MFGKKLVEREIAKIRKELNKDIKDIFMGFQETIDKVDELKGYVECSVCGSLVSKEKAKVEWEMRDKEIYRGIDMLGEEIVYKSEEKEAVKKFICLHCQSKKSKK